MQTDLDDEKVGAAIAGRLRGIAFQYAMGLRASRLDMHSGTRAEMVAPEIFAEPAHNDWTSPSGQMFPAEISGAAFLCQSLATR